MAGRSCCICRRRTPISFTRWRARRWASLVEHFDSCSLPLFTPTPTPLAQPKAFNLRIDSSSTQSFTDPSSNIWLADQAYTLGGFGYTSGGSVFTSTANVTGTNSPALYQTYRAGPNLGYSFTLPAGHYQVTLKFADFISNAPGTNVFNVVLNGTVMSQGLDIYAAV